MTFVYITDGALSLKTRGHYETLIIMFKRIMMRYLITISKRFISFNIYLIEDRYILILALAKHLRGEDISEVTTLF